jgi:hypothetical protein
MDTKHSEKREDYRSPKLEELGSVADLTQTGRTHPGQDAKGGSAASSGR